jgi:dolichyl-phosphate-mannose-protein mannosyltransferase
MYEEKHPSKHSDPKFVGMNKSENVSLKYAPEARETNYKALDIWFVILFTILGLYSRLYNLPHPSEVVFDEQHFGRFTNWYFKGEYYLDIHPPLGKFLLYLSGILFNYNPNLAYDRPGGVYTDKTYVALRLLPAIFGGLLVPLMYLTMRAMRISPAISSLGKLSMIV